MTDDKKQKIDDYIQKVIDLINTKTDNFDKLYESTGKYIPHCDNELQQAIILISGIVKDRKTYNFEKEDVRHFLLKLIIKIKSKYEYIEKQLNEVDEIQSQPNNEKIYIISSDNVRIYIPNEKEKYIKTIINRQRYIINYLANLIKREDAEKNNHFDDVEHYKKMKEMIKIGQEIKAKQDMIKAKQEFLSKQCEDLLKEENNKSLEEDYTLPEKHNTHVYINIDKHSAFEEILEKLKKHGLVDKNNKWIVVENSTTHTKTKFVYFCFVLAQNGFFKNSKYDENKKRYSTPWTNAEKLFHLEKTNSSTLMQNIINGNALKKEAKDDIDNILKPYNLKIPTF